MMLKDILLEHPQKIAELEFQFLGLQKNKEDCDTAIKKLEADIVKLIEDKSNLEEFKQELSNANKRGYAVKEELKNNKGFQELLNESKDLNLKMKKLEIDLGRLKREFRSAEALARL